jgi:class 3 adenylate cyclase
LKPPNTRYARSGDFSVAYQVVGEGPLDLVYIPGAISHLDLAWEHPGYVRFMRRLSSFARVMVLDRRGLGLSDPVDAPPSIEERIDDVRAVMDAVGSERAALLGASEGTCLACYFAATYPDRVSATLLYGSLARVLPTQDYPWTVLNEELEKEWIEAVREAWGEGIILTPLAPSKLSDEREREWWGRYERACVSPAMQLRLMEANRDIDIRDILGLVQAPTLLLHRKGDVIPIEGARYMAERIPGARLIELEGEDHWPWLDDPEEVCDHIEEFLTGATHEPETDRVLATVVFTDIVGSTERAAQVGDRRWRELLESHEHVVRTQLDRHSGREVKMTGDGFLATFDGPARAIRCARASSEQMHRLGLEIRAGLHTGECELRNGDVGGIAVHIGARVMAEAAPGEVLVSSTVKDLTVGSDIEFDDRGARELKGVPGTWRLYAVLS